MLAVQTAINVVRKGMQIMNDTSSFGSFIYSFLMSVRDEFVKLPCLVFPLLSNALSRPNNVFSVSFFLSHNLMIANAIPRARA
jgi:hypothetical protein